MLYANGDEEQQKKPVKIYLQNTNFLKTVVPANRDNATYRQTFFYSQVGYKNELKAADNFDFKVNNNYLFNVGGKYSEPSNQNTYSASDRIEIGEGNKIPLWLFGFLY
jgi:hypothetical protein